MTTIGVVAPKVSVDERPMSAAVLDQLVSLRVERGFCVVGKSTLRFNDPGYALAGSDSFALGTSVSVQVGEASVFSGPVTGVSLEQNTSDVPELIVTAHDQGIRLSRSNTATTFVNASYQEIIHKLATDAGLNADVSGATLAAKNEYVLVTGTLLDLLDTLVRRAGIVWWVDDQQLVVQPPDTTSASVDVTLGAELVEWSVRASALRPTQVHVSGWDPSTQSELVGAGQPPKGPDSTFVQHYVGEGPAAAFTISANSAELRPTTSSEADDLATALLGDAAAGAVVARGTCTPNAAIDLATEVKVAGAGPTQGKYIVSEVEHVYTARGFYTRFVAGPRRPTDLVDTLGRLGPDPGFAISGLVVGIVSDNNDPAKEGRVKLTLSALGKDLNSAWARVATLGGGSNRGIFFQFEIGDEVLVGFEGGDTRRPVVIGGLYSSQHELPQSSEIVKDKKVGFRRITSRNGHVVEFSDDGGGPDHVMLALGNPAHSLRLGQDAFALNLVQGKPMTIAVGNNSSIKITDDGSIEIKGMNIKLEATQNVEISGVQVSAKGQGQASVQAPDLQLKADAVANLQSSGALTIKGSVVQIN